MASAGTSAVRIIDSDNEVATVTSGRLDVNAVLSASDNIEIGNVDIKLNGTAVSADEGDADAGTIRITIADDDNHWGTVGTAADSDGTAHAQLRYIANSFANMQTELESVDSRLTTISGIQSSAVSTTGAEYVEGDGGFLATGVRNDTLASLVSYDHDHAPFQVNTDGALYVEVASSATLTVNSHAVTNAGTFAVQTDATVHPAGNGTFNSYAQFTAATTPTALTDATNGVNDTETAAKEVIIQADFDNSGYIMVGDSGAAADTPNGIRLHAGDMLSLPVANIANIYIDASASSQNVNVTVIK